MCSRRKAGEDELQEQGSSKPIFPFPVLVFFEIDYPILESASKPTPAARLGNPWGGKEEDSNATRHFTNS